MTENIAPTAPVLNAGFPPGGGAAYGAPGLILRLEGAAVLAAAVSIYCMQGLSWWVFIALFLAPDVFMLGYLRDKRMGAFFYNLGHTTLLPLALIAVGWHLGSPISLSIGLIWLGHIGFDRLVGYGLKYPDDFKHTHLGGPVEKSA
jgi:Domain of unknown function (DUF4260)